MDKLKNCPAPLIRKLAGTLLVGLCCLFIGVVFYIHNQDRILLLLSALVFVFSLIQSAGLYAIITGKKYETVEGVCVSVALKLLGRQQKVRIMDVNGIESTLFLNKHLRMRIGTRYRFYLKHNRRTQTGNEFLSASQMSDAYLGFECLGVRGDNSSI